jgi:anti-anti-sigma factor
MDLVELMSPPPASVVEAAAMPCGWVLVHLLSRHEGTGENAIFERRRTMTKYRFADGRPDEGVVDDEILASDGKGRVEASSEGRAGSPRLVVRVIERTALIRFIDAEILFDESVVRAVNEQLNRLIAEECHTRLLLNFGGVQYLSSAVLGILAGLQRKIDPAGGRIRLCGLNPLLRDMLRITHLDGVLDVCSDEAEALGLIVL